MKRPVTVLTGLLILLLMAGYLLGLPDRVSRARDRFSSGREPMTVTEGGQVSITGRITSSIQRKQTQSFYGNTQVIQTFQVSHIHLQHKTNHSFTIYPPTLKIQVTTKEEYPTLQPGNLVCMTGKVRLPQPADVPGSYDMLAYANRKGILFSLMGAVVSRQKEQRSLIGMLTYVRAGLSASYARVMDAEDVGMLSAVTLGDQTNLAGETKRMLREGGIAHILAISGLHINMIGMGLYQLLRRRRVRFTVSALSSAGLLWLYCMMTGMSDSAVRAAVMFTLWTGSQIFGRTPDTPTSLALAAAVLLIRSPLSLFDGGFQLSFGCILSLYYIAPALQKVLRRKRAASGLYILENVSASLAVTLGTLPILCWHYGSFNLYAPLLNLLILPQMSALAATGVVGGLLGWVSLSAGIFAASPCHYLMGIMKLLCHLQEKLPLAVMVTGRPAWWQIALYYGLLIAACHILNNTEKSAQSARKRILAGILVALQLCVLGYHRYPDFRLIFMSVGQGDGILVQKGDTAFLVDGGSSSEREIWNYRIEPCLRFYGIRRLEAVFLSHGDGDHISGVEELAQYYEKNLIGQGSAGLTVERVCTSVVGEKNKALHDLDEAFRQKGVPVMSCAPGEEVSQDGLRIQVLYPGMDNRSENENENSLVLLITSPGGKKILLTGDLEKEGEQQFLQQWKAAEKGTIDILKLGHHGSRYATSEEFLEVLNPQIAVASAGWNNRYRHPAQETLDRLAKAACQVYRTDRQGSVILEEDHGEMRISTWKRDGAL